MRYWLDPPRELTDADFRQMGIGERYAGAVWEKVLGGEALDVARNYVEKLREMRDQGVGMYIFGPNGNGKTALACLILREFRSRGQSCLFVRHSKLTRAAIKGVVVGDGKDMWEYAREVDVLLIDDFGKAHESDSTFDAAELEDLLRDRYDRRLVTLLTSNTSAAKLSQEEYSVRKSTISVIQGMVIPVMLKGDGSRRQMEARLAYQALWEGEDE